MQTGLSLQRRGGFNESAPKHQPPHPHEIRENSLRRLRGATSRRQGWSNELRPEDACHTLIAVHTDEGWSVSQVFHPTTR